MGDRATGGLGNRGVFGRLLKQGLKPPFGIVHGKTTKSNTVEICLSGDTVLGQQSHQRLKLGCCLVGRGL